MTRPNEISGASPGRSRRPPPGILIRAAVYDGSGYADEARGIALGLHRAGIPTQLEPLDLPFASQNLLSIEEREAMEVLKHRQIDLARGVLLQDTPANDFSPWIHARHRVGRTMYETDSIPDGWAEYCEAMDEVWVPSRFNCETFARAGVSPHRLRAMPEGIDTTAFRPGLEPLPIPERRGFTFLSVFEWIQRKGADILLRAYLNEFSPEEDVTLLLKTYARPDRSEDLLPRIAYFVERQMGMRLEDSPPIVVFAPGFLTTEEIPRLYASADAFVLPTRGEGWCRPYMEALACECPVIATRWSGQMDFLDQGICEFVDYDLAPLPWNIDVELSAGHHAAEPRVAHLRQCMRRVFEDRAAAKSKAIRGRREMAEKWDWDKVIRNWWALEVERLLS